LEVNCLPDKLYTLCYRLTGNSQLTEELCFRTVRELKKEDSFTDVVQTVARLFLKYSADGPEKPLADDPFAEVQQALNRLKVEERTVVVLHDVYGLSYAKIADILGKQEVRPLCSQGRLKLSRYLKDRGEVG